MQHKTYKGSFWEEGRNQIPCLVSFKIDGTMTVEGISVDSTGLIFIHSENENRYALGAWKITNGSATRIAPFQMSEEESNEGEVVVEKSALLRLHTILRRGSLISLDLYCNTLQSALKCIPSSTPSHASLFFCQIEHGNIPQGKNLNILATISGMTYFFKSEVVDSTQDSLALKLPEKAVRSLQRRVPRDHSNLEVMIQKPIQVKGTIKDFSPIGIAIEVIEPGLLRKGDEVRIHIPKLNKLSVTTDALVVDVNLNTVRLALSGQGQNIKERFYEFLSLANKDLEIQENPDLAWECLDRFGYFDVLKGKIKGLMEPSKKDCISTWEMLKNDSRNLQPLVIKNREIAGTIAVIQVAEDNWIAHSLASKVDPNFIDVTSVLYYTWPGYILNKATPSWFSAWYDANKPWHNRFFQVFINEHEKTQEVVTFVRKLYISSELVYYPGVDEEVKILEISRIADHDNLVALWSERYKSLISSPSLSLKEGSFNFFKDKFTIVYFRDVFIGITKHLSGKFDVNPMSIMQCVHINLFTEGYRTNPAVIKSVAKAYSNYMKKNGLIRGSITLDYDTSSDILNDTCFVLYGDKRCLSSSIRHFPSLMSNNTLSFSDMLVRKRPL